MSDPNIYQRVNAVMQEVTYAKKDTKVSGGGTFMAVSHDMVLAVLRPAMVKHGIATRVEQLRGELAQMRDKSRDINMHLYVADYAVHFVNVDNPGDCLTVTIQSHANDTGDKAPGKAASYAVKYAMLKTFGLETGENDESRLAPEDISEISKQISEADTLDALQATFRLAWESYPKSRDELSKVKDKRKKALLEAGND